MTIILMTALRGISQKNSATDSCTCILNSQLIAALKDHEQHKICKQENEKLQALLILHKQLLLSRDTTINEYKKIQQAYRLDSLAQEKQKNILQQEKAICEINLQQLNKQLKNQKTQAYVFKGSTGALLLILIYKGIKK